MRFDSKDNLNYFIKNSETKTIREWVDYFGCERATIGRWKKKYFVNVKKARGNFAHSEETKKILSKKRKAWLSQNPDKHPWKNRNKFKSEPCEKAKEFLRKLKISFISEFSPQIDNRYFSIDIALPDKMIALEINGNQHYEKNGKLKPYYQERHDLLTSHGWNVFEIHYSACFNLEKWLEFSKQIIKTPKVNNFDYFNYAPKKNKEKRWQNNCECGEPKSNKAKKCFRCAIKDRNKKIPSKKVLQSLYDSLPMTEIAKLFNISDSAVKKWLKKKDILIKDRRGFWAKNGRRRH